MTAGPNSVNQASQPGRKKSSGKLRQPFIRFGSQAEAATSRLSEVPHTSVCAASFWNEYPCVA